MVTFALEQYQYWYVEQGYSLELGLTGSKMQAVAMAAVTAARKVSQVWYVRPTAFDTARFTKGVGDTGVFEITLSREAD